MLTIIIATQNKNKVKEFEKILAINNIEANVVSAGEIGINNMPDETGSTFIENAYIKAEAVFKMIPFVSHHINAPYVVIADDSGLTVKALNNRPGIYSARYASTDGNDASDRDNVNKLLNEMKDVPEDKRKASFVCTIAAITSDNIKIDATGTLDGVIAFSPKGTNGFGYDPVMYVPEEGSTVAEMTSEKKNQISHRSKAIKKVAERIKEIYF